MYCYTNIFVLISYLVLLLVCNLHVTQKDKCMIKVNLVYNRKTKEGYSLYLRYYCTEKRKFLKSETLNLFVSKKYGKHTPIKSVMQADRQNINIARDILQKRRIEILEQRFSVSFLAQQSPQKIDYMPDIKKVVTAKNHRTYDAMLKYLEKFLNTGEKVTNIEGFQNYLFKNTNISQTSVSHYVNRLRIVLSELKIEYEKTKVVTTKHKPRTFLNSEQVQQIASLETNSENETLTKYAYLFACFTGLRISDFLALSFGDIQNGVMKFTSQKTKNYKEYPLSENALLILQETRALHTEEKIFPIEAWKCQKNIKKIGEKIGVKLTAHTARHTFATIMLGEGVDLLIIKELLGHKKINSTMVYAHVKKETMANAVAKIPKIQLK